MTAKDRIAYHFDSEWKRLLQMYLNTDAFDYNRKIRPHFRLVAEKGPDYRDHPPVLALSLGGSTTKLLIASTEAGLLRVHAMTVTRNPVEPISFYSYLDQLLLHNAAAARYLWEAERPAFCLTLPVMIGEDNIPFHPVKIAALSGLFARGPAEMTPERKLENNVRGYFVSRGLRLPHLYFQSDPVIAHLGGVSQTEPPPGCRSLLLVCGTGMATADDNTQRVISRLPMMDFDEELYPREVTEGYVFESGCAGKGLFDVMARAAALRARESGSALAGQRPEQYFQSLYDSVRVAMLWKELLRPERKQPGLDALRQELPEEALAELRALAAPLMERVVGSLAASLLVTAVKLDLREGRSRYFPLFEGSIALDPEVNPRVIATIQESCGRPELFREARALPPDFDFSVCERQEILFDPDFPDDMRAGLDNTLIGTAIAAIADDILTREWQ